MSSGFLFFFSNAKSSFWIIFLNPNPVCDPSFLFIPFVPSAGFTSNVMPKRDFNWHLLTVLFVLLIYSAYYVKKGIRRFKLTFICFNIATKLASV